MPMLSPDDYLNLEMNFTFVFFKPIGLDDSILCSVSMKHPSFSPDHLGVRYEAFSIPGSERQRRP